MSKTFSSELVRREDGAKYRDSIKEMFVEMKRLNKKMERDQKAIEQMKLETQTILARLKA